MISPLKALTLLSCSLLATAASPDNKRDNGTLVDTAQGKVQGGLVSNRVRQFLGIPYAANAGGQNRWKPPQSPPQFNGTFEANNWSDACPQNLKAFNMEFLKLLNDNTTASLPQSENCLSVNIWAPTTDRKQKTAVMIWVPGGGYEFTSVSRLSLSLTNYG
jgi:carboxylesterase type B